MAEGPNKDDGTHSYAIGLCAQLDEVCLAGLTKGRKEAWGCGECLGVFGVCLRVCVGRGQHTYLNTHSHTDSLHPVVTQILRQRQLG